MTGRDMIDNLLESNRKQLAVKRHVKNKRDRRSKMSKDDIKKELKNKISSGRVN